MAAQVYGVQPLAKIRKTQPPKTGGAFDFKSEIKHRDASPFGSVTAAVRVKTKRGSEFEKPRWARDP
jgi:hypothetical protein